MRVRLTACLMLAALAWFAAAARCGELAALQVDRRLEHPANIHETRFENGLTLLVKETHAAPVVVVRVYVRVGSIYEGERLGSGISHYFEHVIAGGSTSLHTETEHRARLQRLGNRSNAYTSRDRTAYYITTDARHFADAVALLGEYMVHAKIAPNEFRRERGVILQEIRRNQDNPHRAVHALLSAAMFPGHPAGQPVIGHPALFREIGREALVDLYRRYYVANNTVVVVAGAVDPDRAAEEVARAFGGYARGTPDHPAIPSPPRQVSPRWAEERSDKWQQTYLLIGHHTVPLAHPDLYALDVAADILGAGRTSRLYRALRDTGLVHEVYTYSHTPPYDAGVFAVGAVLEDEQTGPTIEAVLDELDRLRTELVSDRELQRAIRHRVTSQVYAIDTIEDQAADIANNYLSTYDPNFTERYLDGIRTVTPQAVQRVARTYLQGRNRTVALVRPAEGEPPTAAAASAEAPQDPGAPEVERVTLDNGVRVLFGPDPNARAVYVQATFLGGVRSETDATNGICRLMSTLLLQGTQQRIKEAFHQNLEALGIRISSNSGNNSWSVSAKCLPQDLDAAAGALAEAALTPRFAQEHFERERAMQIDAVRSLSDDWQAEAGRLFRRTFFAGHPYRLHPLGTVEALQGIELEQVRAYHGRVCNPQACVVAVFGKVDRDEALAAVRAVFAPWPGPEGPYWTPRRDRTLAPAPPLATERNAKTQATLVYGYPGLAMGADDVPALTVLDALLSGYGYPGGWLHQALRGDADLVYLVHAFHWPGFETGAFEILTQTSPANVPQVMDAIDQALDRARRGEFSDEEVAAAREEVAIADALEHQSLEARAARPTYDELYGLGYEHHNDFVGRVRAVTRADLQAVAAKVLARRRTLCATGPAEALAAVRERAAEAEQDGSKPE